LFDPAFGGLSGRYPTGQGIIPFEARRSPQKWTHVLNLLWFNSLFMLISENNMNTCTYLVYTLSLIYIMKLLVIFGIKIYQKLPRCLTWFTIILIR
jgi:hypothetical protein